MLRRSIEKLGVKAICSFGGLAIILLLLSAHSRVKPSGNGSAATLSGEEQWVDSVFNEMNPAERLGQLFMIRAHSDKGASHIAQVENLIRKYHVGGLCFFQGTPEKQVALSNRYQQLTQHVPLMIGIDAEWGLGMRMKKSTISFPRQMMLGAIQDNHLIYEMGVEIARQLRRVGVNVNFAPVADINNNADNPVINFRSFGEDRYNVSVKSYMYMKGMQDNGVMACAKHFPGHGDTGVDSHYDLPVIPHDMERLDSLELYPFKVLAQHGIGSFMVAHLNVPVLDDRGNRPTTLSQKTITGLLKEDIGFDGLVFTDGLDMQAVRKHFDTGQVEAEALVAGNDILLLPLELGATVRTINQYLEDGKLSQAQLDESVRKVLRAKYRMGIKKVELLEEKGVRAELNTNEAKKIKEKLVQNALTLVRNKAGMIPFQELDALNMASLSIGASAKTSFQNRLNSYKKMTSLYTGKEISSYQKERLLSQLKEKDLVIISLHNMSSRASKNYGITKSTRDFIAALQQETKVVLTVFGSPYSLKYFDDIDWLLEAYNEDGMTQGLAAQSLFGVFALKGRLPVTASDKSKFNTGVFTKKNYRIGYAPPESVGLNPDSLAKIDQLVRKAINSRATPGAVVLVAKEGKIVYEKAFGYHTYSKRKPVDVTDVYDLASMTKILATTLSLMKLQDEGKVDIEQPLSNYLPILKSSNKADIKIKDMMAHIAGLKGWIPFYEQTVSRSRRNPRPLSKFYKYKADDTYNVPVTENLFLRSDFTDSIWQQIIHSDVRTDNRYVYSDLGFYLLSQLVEKVTGKSIDAYVRQTFYQPLGLGTATYNPWKRFPIEDIVPTEQDKYFRRQKVHGYVHDMGAAMLGGVSGHAGLFANARDVSVLMQLLLQEGFYGGQQYIKPETIKAFTTRHPRSNRRGIGFDMKQLNPDLTPNMADLASEQTFGHTGFTGTCTWADPAHDIVFVFLSNRTYPSMRNYKLVRDDYRENIQNIIYQAIERKSASSD